MNELALFAGAGGGILGGRLRGWRTICAVEFDQYARDVLVARQNDGCLAPFPIWDDVRTFDGRPWHGIVDIVSGGFPCQDISCAGRRAGITGARSGLWAEMARIVREVQPRFVWVENSPMLVGRGLGMVLLDLAKMGFNARWGIVGACDAGAPHKRDRIWVLGWNPDRDNGREIRQVEAGMQVADAIGIGQTEFSDSIKLGSQATRTEQQAAGTSGICGDVADSDNPRQHSIWGGPETSETRHHIRRHGQIVPDTNGEQRRGGKTGIKDASNVGESPGSEGRRDWWNPEPKLGRVANGVANRVDRLRCIGNGQVPAVVRLAWHILAED